MLRKKYEFRPDRMESSALSKLYLTKKQRYSLLKWFLYATLLVLLSLVQDVIMSRVHIRNATTDLVACGILLICMHNDADSGSRFAVAGSLFYYLSGTAPGPQVILLLTAIGCLFNIFRSSYLRRGMLSTLLCTSAALAVYKLVIFALAVFLGNSSPERLTVFGVSCLLCVAVLPLLYPFVVSIGKIGGESWKD